MKGKSLMSIARAEKPRRSIICAVCSHDLRKQIDDCIRDGLFPTAIVRALAARGEKLVTVSQLKHHKGYGHVAAR